MKHKLFTLFTAVLLSTSLWAQCNITAVQDPTSGYTPTQIVNGSFEEQPWMSYVLNGNLYDSYEHKYGNGSWTEVDYSIPNGVNLGWNTTETHIQGGTLFEAGGGQAEMNAVNSAVLYQDLYTHGNDVIRWSLGHRARSDCGDNVQDIRVEVGAPNYSGDDIVYAHGVTDDIVTEINEDTKVIYRSDGVTEVGSAHGSGENLENLSVNKSSQNSQFYYASGIYVVPAGQNVTRFGFVSEDTDRPDCGNYLTGITFSTLIGDLSATSGEANSVIVQGYWGEDDTNKKLVIEIGDQTLNVDMSGVVGENFMITIPHDCIGETVSSVAVYHEDYESAKTTLPVNQAISVTAENVNVVYDGVTSWGISPVVTVPASGYTITYGTSINECNSATSPTFMEPGTHTIYYMVTAPGYTTEKRYATVYIDKKPFPMDLVITPPTPINGLMQNGQYQTLVNAGSATGFTMAYALGINGNTAPTEGWSTSLPIGKHWGDYYVWYKALGGDYHHDSNAGYVVAHINEPPIRTVNYAVMEDGMGAVQMTSIYYSEDFETGVFNLPTGWTNDATYPWGISGNTLKSSNEGQPNTTSSLTAAVTLPLGGTISFRYRKSGEQYNDIGRFYTDGTQKVWSYYDNWTTYSNNDLSAGNHTFKWEYYKNGSNDDGEDAFFIDDIVIRELLPTSTTSVQIANGEQEYMKAIPSDTYHFVNWTDESNNVLGTSTTLNFSVLRDITVTANFAANPVLTIQSNGTGNGTIAFNNNVLPSGVIDHGDGTYSVFPGTQITLKATAAEGSFFAGWDNASDNSTRTFTVNSNMTVAATFTAYATLQVSSNNESLGTVDWEMHATGEQQLTICDGSTTNNVVPAYLCWFDGLTKSQFIIPAEKIEKIGIGGIINKITYYINSNQNFSITDDVVDVYLKAVDYTTFSSYVDKSSCTTVYSGVLSSVGKGSYSEVTFTFDTPYTYHGGNLLVGLENENSGGNFNCGCQFIGESAATGASAGGVGGSFYQYSFLPKSTFTYIPGEPQENPAGGYYITPGDEITATATVTGGSDYGFLNWTANGVPVSTELEINYTVTETVNLVGNFAPKVTVTYEGNGNDAGEAPTDETIYLVGQSVTILAAPSDMLKTGYTFLGWINSIDGHTYAAGESFTITASTTLTAKWGPTPYISGNPDPENADTYYSSFYYGLFKYVIPSGVEAYVATINENDLYLKKIAKADDVLPEATAVILKSTVAGYTMVPTNEDAVVITEANALRGVDTDTDIADVVSGKCYVLSGRSKDNTVSGVGFYLYEAPNQLKAHKAFVDVPESSGEAPKRMRFVFDTETGIDPVTDNPSPVTRKILRDGQLIIIRGDREFNVQGQIIK